MQEENIENPEPVQEVETVYTGISQIIEPAQNKVPFFAFNFNTLLGLILLVGLVVLYVLHFTGRNTQDTTIPLAVQKSSGKQLSVVYVNIDSINTHYEYVKILRKDLESTGKRLQTEVLAEQSGLEKEASDFQRQISANAIPEDKAKVIYEQLMQKQQALMQKKDRYTQQIGEQEMGMNLRLVDSVTAFLKRFNRQYQFDYIMAYKSGGEILVSNDTMDITKSVLEELNKEYQQRKK
ncbi:MAG: OmpH family outer membrane protein [Bacteroidetes bacterium]|nr:OmpH family outer membrane protein [Bacteroidota bacterium]